MEFTKVNLGTCVVCGEGEPTQTHRRRSDASPSSRSFLRSRRGVDEAEGGALLHVRRMEWFVRAFRRFVRTVVRRAGRRWERTRRVRGAILPRPIGSTLAVWNVHSSPLFDAETAPRPRRTDRSFGKGTSPSNRTRTPSGSIGKAFPFEVPYGRLRLKPDRSQRDRRRRVRGC
eukprot:scaffold684_cov345-Pavlova_lutheri.AAC.34